MITLYKNGNIHTMDNIFPIADSFVVKDNKFVYVGTKAGAQEYSKINSRADNEVDLCNYFVLPGFNDSH